MIGYDVMHAKSHGLCITNLEKVATYTRQFEGLRLKPYKCTAGKLSIGFGHNLDDNGITEEVAELLLKIDLENAEKDCLEKVPCYTYLDDARKFVLIDMMFNLGASKLLSFKKMLSALDRKDFITAANEMKNSKWHTQVGNRAKMLENIMLTGVW